MLRYSRSYLLSLCFWGRRAYLDLSQSSPQSLNHLWFGPLSPVVWNSLKSSDLLRTTRGKRGGQRLTTHRKSLQLTLEVCDNIVQWTKSLNIQNRSRLHLMKQSTETTLLIRTDRPISRKCDILNYLIYWKKKFTTTSVTSILVKLQCFEEIARKLMKIWIFKARGTMIKFENILKLVWT